MMNPKRRFKKADGTIFADWKNVPFANIFQEYNVKNTACLPQYTAGKYGLKPIDNEKIRYNIQNHKAFSINSLILGIGIEEVGVATNYPGCVSPIYTTYQIQDHKANSLFIAYYIKNVFAKNKGRITHKSTRREYEFEPTELKKIDIPLPDSLEEQEKIANFLFEIDNLIASAEAEIEKTKNFKKAMLQKMFPKDGESVPEIRFPGFTDDWEQRKLGDVLSLENGYAFQSEYFVDEKTGFVVATPGNVRVEGGFICEGGKNYSVDGPCPDRFVFKPGDIFVTMTDLTPSANTLGKPAIVPDNKTTYLHNQRLGKLVDFDGDKQFLFALLCTERYHTQMVKTASGTTVRHSSPDRILNYEAWFPKIKEQVLIGQVFMDIDNLITLHQRKANAYKKLKKAMMQQLFV